MDHHDHSHMTHTAKCDLCDYVAEAHAHDEEGALDALTNDLAKHNKEVHDMETDPQDLKEPVKAKMVEN